MIREVHFLFLLFVCHIWSVTIHQIFTMYLSRCRSSHRRCSVTKGVLRNFPKSTGKHLVQSLSFNKVAGVMFPCLYIYIHLFMCFNVDILTVKLLIQYIFKYNRINIYEYMNMIVAIQTIHLSEGWINDSLIA